MNEGGKDDLGVDRRVVAGNWSAGFGELLQCRVCGGKPYAYDMRGKGTHEICTVECGSCDNEVQAESPEVAASKWHAVGA
jgi:hypothetical protein